VLLVVGDHGFVDVKTTVSPNVWLKEAGLANDVKKDDWKAQFNSVGGSSYLYLKNHDQQTLDAVKKILAQLPGSKRKLFAVIDRKKLDQIGANPEVALALTGLNGAAFNNSFTGEDVKPGHGGTHGYFPDFREIQTGFLAYGPGIRKGGVIPEMNLRDIAPAVARILGLDLPSAKGRIPAVLFSGK
jgi:predicted AlkP superfamily pyrophosphatase or phosphodiesterase